MLEADGRWGSARLDGDGIATAIVRAAPSSPLRRMPPPVVMTLLVVFALGIGSRARPAPLDAG